MAAVTRQFNGTVIQFAAAPIGQVTGISMTQAGTEIDTSDIDDAMTLYEVGQTDVSIQVTIVGSQSASLEIGDVGAVVLTWTDGTVENLADSVITNRSPAGTKNGAIATTYTLRPSQPVA